ncbi:hypothetical protein NC653_018125 [Populus alba x Populus x berolinensis]|uniref:Uncharacterized protein n=1 Tax=Populus alba x Populus x berolinensis TaxID=444605 RepID=A0AAD6QRY9_9ROSI|nr:hypothetical protein NC653_018125 [Populus alba x Populus x berolinensis]
MVLISRLRKGRGDGSTVWRTWVCEGAVWVEGKLREKMHSRCEDLLRSVCAHRHLAPSSRCVDSGMAAAVDRNEYFDGVQAVQLLCPGVSSDRQPHASSLVLHASPLTLR